MIVIYNEVFLVLLIYTRSRSTLGKNDKNQIDEINYTFKKICSKYQDNSWDGSIPDVGQP